MLQLDFALQQSAHLHIVVVGQQILRRRLLVGTPCFLQLLVGLGHILLRRQHRLARGLCPLVRVAFDGLQLAHRLAHHGVEVVFCPLPELRRVASVVFAQRFFHLLDAACHLEHPHKLVCRMRDVFRE